MQRRRRAQRLGTGQQRMRSLTKRPARAVRVASLQAIVDRRENGVIYVRSPQPLGEYPPPVTDRLEFCATQAPNRIFLPQRPPPAHSPPLPYPDPFLRPPTLTP